MLEIRTLLPQDIHPLVDIDSVSNQPAWTENMFREELTKEFSMQAVVVRNSKPIGFGILWKVQDMAQLLEIAILPQERRKGIGTHLLQHLMKKSAENGCSKMELELRQENLPALEFYHRLGFKLVSTRKNFYPPISGSKYSDALLMECDL